MLLTSDASGSNCQFNKTATQLHLDFWRLMGLLSTKAQWLRDLNTLPQHMHIDKTQTNLTVLYCKYALHNQTQDDAVDFHTTK